MSLSLYDKLALEQEDLERKVQDAMLHRYRNKEKKKDKRSYAMHTPISALIKLGEKRKD